MGARDRGYDGVGFRERGHDGVGGIPKESKLSFLGIPGVFDFLSRGHKGFFCMAKGGKEKSGPMGRGSKS